MKVPRGLYDRSASCETCVLAKGFAEFYQCRADTPSKSGWPRVKPDDWCGHYAAAGADILNERGVKREERIDRERTAAPGASPPPDQVRIARGRGPSDGVQPGAGDDAAPPEAADGWVD